MGALVIYDQTGKVWVIAYGETDIPQEISGISYKVYFRGEKYQIDIAQNQTPKILRII